MQFRVVGCSRDTGEDVTLTLEAPTPSAAQNRGNELGVLVESVVPVETGPMPYAVPVAAPTPAISPMRGGTSSKSSWQRDAEFFGRIVSLFTGSAKIAVASVVLLVIGSCVYFILSPSIEKAREIAQQKEAIRDTASPSPVLQRPVPRETTTPPAMFQKPPARTSRAESRRPPDFDASPAKQSERRKFIEDVIALGLWEKTEFTGSLPKLWVTKEFLLADEKFQNKTLSVVYAYWVGELDTFGGSGFFWDSLVLKIDNGTAIGRRVATYTPLTAMERK